MHVYHKVSLVEENQGIRVVLVLLPRKNILQKTNQAKTRNAAVSLEPYDSEASSDTDSTIESDEEQFERPQNTEW